MKILSLFDGHSGGRIALDKIGVNNVDYYASEIDKWAQSVARYLYPDTVHLGDVRNIYIKPNQTIDGIMAGSPCTDLSFGGKQKGLETANLNEYLKLKSQGFNFKGESYLFWEFVRLVRDIRPTWFLLENVRMSAKNQDVISNTLGFEPTVINSNLVSAQNRHRLYWVGKKKDVGYEALTIGDISNRNILLRDIIHETCTSDLITPTFNVNPSRKGQNGIVRSANQQKSLCVTTNKGEGQKILIEDLAQYHVPYEDTIALLEEEIIRGKITYHETKEGVFYFIHDNLIGLNQSDDALLGCIEPSYKNKKQNGQRFSAGKKFYTLTARPPHGVLVEGLLRKITPIEAERLQTLDDDTTKYGILDGKKIELSKTQRYYMLGRGWTSTVIQILLKTLFKELKVYGGGING